MKGSDYVAQFVRDQGVEHAFVLIGGACAHLIDSFGRAPNFKTICMQHEQGAAMAADGYARVHRSRLGVAMATSGPGATNLITGIACSYFDSVPTLYITGQVNTFESKGELGIRQMGFQETDIVSMVKPITKYAVLVTDPKDLRRCLEEAVYWAHEGRPGPVLVDIPFNVQTADLDFATMAGFDKPARGAGGLSGEVSDKILAELAKAKRPVMLLGFGVRAAGAKAEALALAEKLDIPVVTSWSGLDLIPKEHPLYRGQIGVYGARAANFTLQNTDFLFSIGSRLDSRQTGGNYKSFAREAFRVIVDVDGEELKKPRVVPHVAVVMDAKDFLSGMLKVARGYDFGAWKKQTAEWVERLPVFEKNVVNEKATDPYRFLSAMSEQCDERALIAADTGANLSWTMQAFKIRGEQRLISAFGNSPMGYSLPAAIGMAFAEPGRQVICIIGDGGLQINLQELQTIRHYNLPVKVIVMNNKGYGIIKQFQELYLEGRYIASGEGYSVPDFGKIATAYDLPFGRVSDDRETARALREMFAAPGAYFLEVLHDPEQKIIPKLGWGRPIEDQLPYLPRDEWAKYMMIEPLESSKASKNEIN